MSQGKNGPRAEGFLEAGVGPLMREFLSVTIPVSRSKVARKNSESSSLIG